jgi:BirA family biotin operon repressor/biotin-[acetyl-CoA-carboxylase] ligase
VAFDTDLYQRHRSSTWLGAQIAYREETVSTMDDARAGAAADQPEGIVFVAGIQTGGRGRLGRQWVSGESGLWATYHITSPEAAFAPLVGLAGALAVADAIRETALLSVDIKWPNDILHGGLKLAGILAESSIGERVDIFLGIGINIRAQPLPRDVAARATSIEEAGGAVVEREVLLAALSAALELYVTQLRRSPAVVVEQWRSRLVTLGQRVQLHTPDGDAHEGEAFDVTPRGELMLRLDGGRVVIFAAGDATTAAPSGHS